MSESHIHIHNHCGDGYFELKNLLEAIMATQEQLVEQVQAIGETLTKIGTETSTLLTRIDELTAAVAAAGNVTPELQAAVDAVAAQAGTIDALVPDVVPPAPPAP